MTQDDQDAEIAKAVRAYSASKAQIACLQRRLAQVSRSVQGISDADGPDPARLEEVAALPNDPRQDARDLKKLLDDQIDLKHFFREHNLTID